MSGRIVIHAGEVESAMSSVMRNHAGITESAGNINRNIQSLSSMTAGGAAAATSDFNGIMQKAMATSAEAITMIRSVTSDHVSNSQQVDMNARNAIESC